MHANNAKTNVGMVTVIDFWTKIEKKIIPNETEDTYIQVQLIPRSLTISSMQKSQTKHTKICWNCRHLIYVISEDITVISLRENASSSNANKFFEEKKWTYKRNGYSHVHGLKRLVRWADGMFEAPQGQRISYVFLRRAWALGCADRIKNNIRSRRSTTWIQFKLSKGKT